MKKRLIMMTLMIIILTTTCCGRCKLSKNEKLEAEIAVLKEENKRLSKKVTEGNSNSIKNEAEKYIDNKFPVDGKIYKVKDKTIILYEDIECRSMAGFDEIQIISPTIDTLELWFPDREIVFSVRALIDGEPAFLYTNLYPVLEVVD